MEDSAAEESPKEVNLRDRVFTKAEIDDLEKPKWIEVKDIIFETDKNILDYLSFHCKRWRKQKKNQLNEETISVNNSQRNFRQKGARTGG